MKKILIISGVIMLLLFSTFAIAAIQTQAVDNNAVVEKLIDKTECKHGQCSAIKDNGERCKNCCQEGSWYCWSHNHQ